MKNITYDELPSQLQAIIPKNRFHSATQVTDKRILIRVNYDMYNTDCYNLKDGRWEFWNPPISK